MTVLLVAHLLNDLISFTQDIQMANYFAGLSGKDIINHLMEKGNPMDANMKRQIRAELIRGVRHGDFSYVEDEYTRRKYYSKF